MAETKNKQKKSFFDNPLLSTKIKTAKVSFFPELLLGYLAAPILALISNAIINAYLLRYYTDVMGLTAEGWAGLFGTILPIASAVIVIIGNLVVGKIMENMKTKAGKARPLLILSLPLLALAIFMLFFAPYPEGDTISENIWTLILIAVGYNLYYAVAYPFYYTSHSALVNLSTRDSTGRSLLATGSNAAMVGAAGLAGMVVPFFLNFLFVPVMGADGTILSYDTEASYNNWRVFMIVLVVTAVLGILCEYYFTRERITEESFASRDESAAEQEKPAKAKVSMGKQISVCLKDKYWWLVILFFFFYQLGGQLKNNSITYYSVAWFGSSDLAGTISIVGAVPTAAGMVIIWPIAQKFGKAKSIKVGAILAFGFGLLGFIGYGGDVNSVSPIIPILAFVLKALGTVPAMYVSLALLSDVLDHQEALHGFRTDGFTMAVYGSIMIAMTGIASGIIIGLISVAGYSSATVTSTSIRNMTIWLFFGAEVICYAIIFILFNFMGVEKYSALDHEAIIADQRAEAEKEGREYVEPSVRLELEQKEAEAVIEAERISNLKSKCEKKGLSFEEEEAKYQEALAQKKALAEEKKKLADQKKADKEAAAKAKYEALSQEEKAKVEAKKAAKAQKEVELRQAYNQMRAEIAEKEGRSAIAI